MGYHLTPVKMAIIKKKREREEERKRERKDGRKEGRKERKEGRQADKPTGAAGWLNQWSMRLLSRGCEFKFHAGWRDYFKRIKNKMKSF